MAIEYKGGRCQVCRYDRCAEALEFHHIDPTKKDFGISSKGYARSWEKVKREVDKCFLLNHFLKLGLDVVGLILVAAGTVGLGQGQSR